MEYKPKSGSQKRKEKAEKEKREQESSVNQKTLNCPGFTKKRVEAGNNLD